jgi:hypothetical protein
MRIAMMDSPIASPSAGASIAVEVFAPGLARRPI